MTTPPRPASNAPPDETPWRDLADAMPHIVWTHDEEGTVTYLNRSWTMYTGLDLGATLSVGAVSVVHADDRAEVLRLFSESRERGVPLSTEYRLLRASDRSFRWHQARVVPLRTEAGRVVLWAGTAIDVHEERRAAEEQAFLVEAGRVLGASLDVETTLGDVARLVVPRLADWCTIDLATDDGGIARAAVAHVDPTKVELGWELWRRSPPSPEDAVGAYAVLRTGGSQLLADIDDELLDRVVPDAEIRRIIGGLGLRSSMTVPLTAKGAPLGVLTLVSAESRERFDDRRLAFAEALAQRIAVAIDNARLYGATKDARAAAEEMASAYAEQARQVEAALVAMRSERDEAVERLRAVEAAGARSGG
jgi:PAS domain S-box-containing protein